MEPRDFIGKKTAAALIAVRKILPLFGVLLVLWFTSVAARGQADQTIRAQDPDNPTVRYTLNKLNQEILDNAHASDKISTLQDRVSKLEEQKIAEHLAKIDANQETSRTLIMAILGGIVTMLLKDLLGAFTFKKNP
jgi:hypothetical protein